VCIAGVCDSSLDIAYRMVWQAACRLDTAVCGSGYVILRDVLIKFLMGFVSWETMDVMGR
jgi:hypothetical protein